MNAYGELVGINSAVLSPGGQNVGISFAIPVATAKSVMDQIVAHGKVIRGWIGAEYADVNSMQNAGSRMAWPSSASTTTVRPRQAGLKAGDILTTLDGEPIASQLELRNREAAMAPGTSVKLGGTRNGKDFSLSVSLAERPQRQAPG